MSYESEVQDCYATDEPLAFQAAFQGFDCMKAEARKIAAKADAELAALRAKLEACERENAAGKASGWDVAAAEVARLESALAAAEARAARLEAELATIKGK